MQCIPNQLAYYHWVRQTDGQTDRQTEIYKQTRTHTHTISLGNAILRSYDFASSANAATEAADRMESIETILGISKQF